MNDFESELKKQTVRQIPSHWRGQILSGAARDLSLAMRGRKASWSWRELFWPAPKVWAGIAAAWVLVFFLNVSSGTPAEITTVASSASGIDRVQGFEERRRLLVELLAPAESVEETPLAPRRRSDKSPEAFAV
jgi:hypothetical protein